MDALDLLLTRESALKLDAPAPSEADLDTMFQSAVRAPDHGRLRPWRFVVIEGDKRARLGELMADAMRNREPDVAADMLDRERAKPMRAPTIACRRSWTRGPMLPRAGFTPARRNTSISRLLIPPYEYRLPRC